MDRRNDGDPLAPPRPPKLLPRVHRPRAPEPTIMSEAAASEQRTYTSATTAATATATPCTSNSNQQQQQQQHSGSSSNISSNKSSQQQLHSITATTASTNLSNNNNNSVDNSVSSSIGGNNNINNNSSGNQQNNNVIVLTPLVDYEDYQIHHLTYLPQRPSSLSRNSSHVSSASSSSSVTAANSFTRRRPPPPTPGAAVPLLTITSGSGSSSSNASSNFLSHFQNADPVPASPVTLAQPRPESERLTNEYVDTPLRTAQQLQLQLQHASRIQHPAGQHDNGQTTTHHLLLLPQRELRQQQQQLQQQQQHQQQQHSSRLVGTAGSATATTGTDGTDGFLHSHHHNHNHNHNHSPHHHHHNNNHNHKASPQSATQTSQATTGKVTPPPLPRGVGFANVGAQPITQPITKQPASSVANSTCKFAKDLPALDELLDLHNISPSIATVNGSSANALGTPIIIGGDPASLNPITCPRCDKCRCEQCQSPRPLPQTWVCNKTCLCSAESVIDYASCLCCAKALFYHCARDNDLDCDDGSGTPCVDNPCSCGPYKRTQRWSWLGALSIVLPCLWCYWPMRGCVSLCEKCYGRYAGRGCRCQQIGSTSSMVPIVQLGVNGISPLGGNGSSVAGAQNGGTVGGQSATKTVGGGSGGGGGGHHHHHHHHHYNECSTASRILRKGDLTPEKRLLDSSPEY